MDLLQSKYENFQRFCNEILPKNDFIQVLQTTPLPLFLQTIKSKHDANKTLDEIIAIICEKAEINPDQFEKPVMDKFKRYIEYFSQVIETIK